ncbi:MAG: AbrB/MazE/SpoVT family DNA-binding domain-containing protein [Oscillospiraceae bacterium]
MILISERKIDNLGRLVLPSEIRTKYNITEKSLLEIYDDNGKIVLQKANPSCKMCGSCEEINTELMLCDECIQKVKSY